MPPLGNGPTPAGAAGKAEGITEVRRQEALLKTGALQTAILTSANFSIIATDEKGIIQLFNVGAERMLGYTAAEVVNRIRPSDIHDTREVMARARGRAGGRRGPGVAAGAVARRHRRSEIARRGLNDRCGLRRHWTHGWVAG